MNRIVIIGSTVLLVALATAIATGRLVARDLPLTEEVAAVEVTLGTPGYGANYVHAFSTEAGAVAALLQVVEAGTPVADHKCRDAGEILLRSRAGSVIRLGLLAGHDEGTWQVRVHHDFSCVVLRVEREAMARALEHIGISASASATLVR